MTRRAFALIAAVLSGGAIVAGVMAVGDGRNDIDMLEWASVDGRGVSMGQAPDEVIAASNERTASDIDDGVAALLEAF